MDRIFWAGDSTAAWNGYDTFPQTGIGQGYQLYVRREAHIMNYAKNGSSTKSFIDDGLLAQIEEIISEGDFLYIQFGHNDEKQRPDRFTDPDTSYRENLAHMAEAARKKGAFPLFITPLYRRHFDDNGHVKEGVHLGYPDAMKALAARLGVPCVDLCERSRSLLEQAGDLPSRRWFMHLEPGRYENYPKGLKDDTHLHYEGAVKMAGLIAKEVRKIGIPYDRILADV